MKLQEMPDKLGVSIVKYLCPICGKEADNGIIMNSLLTEENAKEVEKLHNKAIGYADHACKECATYKDKAVFFVGIDASKSTKTDPYRTGQIVGVKKEAEIVEHCKKFIQTLSDGSQYCLIDNKVGKTIGLW